MDIMPNQLRKTIIVKFVQVSLEFLCKIKLKYSFDKTLYLDIDECALGVSCGYNSICVNSIGSFSCHCNKGFTSHNLSSGCHAIQNICPDGIICDKNAACKHVGGLHVSFSFKKKV